MKCLRSIIAVLCCFLLVPSIPIQAQTQTEIERFMEWQEMLVENQTQHVFVMQQNMDMHDICLNIEKANITIQTNGYQLILQGYNQISNVDIKGRQDTALVVLEEQAEVELTDVLFENTQGPAMYMKNESVACGGWESAFTEVIKGISAIEYEGDITLRRFVLEGNYACKGKGTITSELCYAKGITQATSITSSFSYFETLQVDHITRKQFVITSNTPSNNDVHVSVLKGSDLNKDVIPYVNVPIIFENEDYTTYIKAPITYKNKEIQFAFSDKIKAILQQNTYQYDAAWVKPKLHVNYFTDFASTIQIEDEFGFYAYITMPSLYGGKVEVEYSDGEDWKTQEVDPNTTISDNSNTSIFFRASNRLTAMKTYYFRYRIVGGLYDGYESKKCSVAIIKSVIGNVVYPMELETMDDGITMPPPNNGQDFDESERPEDSKPIVGNNGQGGGRGESGYQPQENEKDTSSTKKDAYTNKYDQNVALNANNKTTLNTVKTGDTSGYNWYIGILCSLVVFVPLGRTYKQRKKKG